ncbi:MAG: 4Fe-4S binding protein [Candidatus Rokubacteria bacterium]|nr:4Fe-4S binding protein [Candidatus Rokubacteria bacterium]
MRIDEYRCVACGNCVSVCPVGAIYIDPVKNRATVNQDECVECYTCFRGLSVEHLYPPLVRGIRRLAKAFRFRFDPEPDVCPTAAIVPQELQWPRVVRRAFSDPIVPHESTGIMGRGTEEVKTNELTGRIGPGEAGLTVEFGRPGIGARFWEIQEVTRALARLGVAFEKKNPVTALMTDPRTGALNPDILNEKVLSAIVEVKTTQDTVPRILEVIEGVGRKLDTVISVGVGVRCEADGGSPVESVLQEHGYEFHRGKTNLGLGRRSSAAAPTGAPANRGA